MVDFAYIHGFDDLTTYFRPATEEEISKVKCPYKNGDLLWVKNDNVWELRYSTGEINKDGCAVCYSNQQKYGVDIFSWKEHMPANNITLPND